MKKRVLATICALAVVVNMIPMLTSAEEPATDQTVNAQETEVYAPKPFHYYSFDEINEDGTYPDLGTSPNKADGEVVGRLGIEEGHKGKAAVFSHANHMEIQIADPNMEQYTMTAWIKWNGELSSGQPSNKYNPIIVANNGYLNEIFYIGESPSTLRYYNNLHGGDVASKDEVQSNEWVHVAFTKSATQTTVYMNGIQAAMWAGANLSALKNVLVGADTSDTSGNEKRHFNGAIDEVKIYKRALTADEIHAVFSDAPEKEEPVKEPSRVIRYNTTMKVEYTIPEYNSSTIHLIDGKGLNDETSPEWSVDATHNNSGAGWDVMWHSNTGGITSGGYVQIDLGDTYQLDEMYVWNFNQNAGGVSYGGRGLKNVKIQYSTDNENWTSLEVPKGMNFADGDIEYPFQFAQANGQPNLKATNLNDDNHSPVSFDNKAARYVRITPAPQQGNGNWGQDTICGLSEVRFTYVPEGTMKVDEYKKNGTAPDGGTGKAFVGWYTGSTCTEVYEKTTGYAYPRFVDIEKDSTAPYSADESLALVDFMGGSLRKDGEDYNTTSLRFGYNLILPEELGLKDAKWLWKYGYTQDNLYKEVKGNNKITAEEYNERTGEKRTGLISNIVIKNIPVASYKTKVYTQLHLNYTTPDGTRVTEVIEPTIKDRSVWNVAEAIVDDKGLAEDSKDKIYARQLIEAKNNYQPGGTN